MSGFKEPNETTAPPNSEYEWRYEYYDYETPISFEGLKANRYSIVIGFWVGLAVFVIFMFFVLTLLTKTGAPHPEATEACEKRAAARVTGSTEDLRPPADGAPRPSSARPLLDNSLFQCYVREEQQGDSRTPWATPAAGGARAGGGPERGGPPGHGGSASYGSYAEEAEPESMALLHVSSSAPGNRTDTEAVAHFDIPNFVNSLGEDDLLLGEAELPIALDGAACRSDQ